MTDLASLLNAEQLEAATAPDGPLLILAAAGTGKTRTLVYRVVHLIERGVAPWEILLLTFTNRAAREMLERAESVTPGITSGLWGGTFHHVANRMLRRYAPRLGFPNDFRILDPDDQKSLMRQCIKDAGYAAKTFPKREVVLSLLSGAVNRGLDLLDYVETKNEDGEVSSDSLIKVINAYTRKKDEIKAMDFDDLLVFALRLLEEHDDVREHYQNRFKHVLVDEYQDTNILQSAFVNRLAEGHQNISVVGDDFQCIYTWRGSNYRNIMDFPTQYPGARVIKLEQNYRSRPEILAVANESIKHNPDQFQKVLRPTRDSVNARPKVYDVYSDREQSDTISQIIRRACDDGYNYSDIAILYRSHFHSIETQMLLGRTHVPYAITSGVGFFDQAHAKDIISLVRLAEFPADWLSFERVLTLLRGLGPAGAEKLWAKMGGVYKAEEADHRNNLLAFMTPSARAQWEPISEAIANYKATKLSVTGFVSAFITAYYESYLNKEYDNPKDRLDDVRELATEIERRGSVTEFLSDIALLTNVDVEGEKQRTENEPHVLLSTIHQAKGLEWPIVIILWAVEGMFPSNRSIVEESDDSEERRLFYVAVTRAKEQLHIFTPRTRYLHDGGMMDCLPSRFVKEIPDTLLEKHAPSQSRRRYSPYSFQQKNY